MEKYGDTACSVALSQSVNGPPSHIKICLVAVFAVCVVMLHVKVGMMAGHRRLEILARMFL